MVQGRQRERQQSDADHCQPELMRADEAFAFRNALFCDAKELLNAEPERYQRRRRPNPGEHRRS
jgi:hypothetical protein